MTAPDAVRMAGVLLLIDSSLRVLTWAIQLYWDWTPTWPAVVETTVQAALGGGLLRFGRRFILPALALVLFSAARPLVRVAPMFAFGGVAVLAPPLLLGLLRFMPVALLVVGTPSRARHTGAIIAFVVSELLNIAVWILQIYATERMDQP